MKAKVLAEILNRNPEFEVLLEEDGELGDFSITIEHQGLFDTSGYKGWRNAIDRDIKLWIDMEDGSARKNLGDPIQERDAFILS